MNADEYSLKIMNLIDKSGNNKKNDDEDSRLLEKLAKQWANNSPDTALAWLKTVSHKFRSKVWQWMVMEWVNSNPSLALSRVLSLPEDRGFRDAILAGVADELITEHPFAAREWGEKLSPGEIRSEMFTSLSVKLAKINIVLAKEWVLKLSDNNDRACGFYGIASYLARSNPTNAAEWANELKENKDKKAAISGVVSVWSKKDVVATLEWVSHFQQDDIRLWAIPGIALAIAEKDPYKAVDILLTLPKSCEERNIVLSRIIYTLGRKDFTYSMKLIDELPKGGELQNQTKTMLLNIQKSLKTEQIHNDP